MPWRTVEHAGARWSVSVAAERRPQSAQWALVFGFRMTAGPVADGGRHRTLWVPAPVESASQATLFQAADRMRQQELVDLLAARLT